MKKKIARKIPKIHLNIKLTMLVVGLFFCAVIAKLSYVVLSTNVDGINLTEFANNRNTTKETLYASRGVIYDVYGTPLAKNANSYKVIAILSSKRTTDPDKPKHVVDKEATATKLCSVLASAANQDGCIATLKGYFAQDLYQVELGNYGKVSEDERQAILEMDLPGIEFVELPKQRQYINSSWASYIIGYARGNDEGEIVGEMGIESYFNDELKGQNGYVEYQQDAYGYKMATSEEIREDAVSGSDVYLTIDSDVQNVLENGIANFSKDKSLEWAMFVVFSWLAAMENGLYNGEDTFQSGTIKLSDGGTIIKDFNNVGWGVINYDTGFAYSSNVAATNLALKIGSAKLNDFYDLAGFGKKTGITLPGEAAGKIDFMYESEVANASFGQGILVTPVQLLQAMSAMANDGVMVRPYIVDKIVDSNGNVTMQGQREEVGKIASSESVQKMKELLYNVVYNSFSYNKSYAPENVTIAGKTGTAQIASTSGGYLTGEYDYIKSFLGMFPYEEPEYIFYFATKKYVGPSKDIYDVVSNTIKEVANIVNVTDSKNDVDESKIIYLTQYISKDVNVTSEELKKLGLTPVILGNGKYVINQYPLDKTKVIKGSKVFLLTNDANITMPDVIGWSTNEVIRLCNMIGLNYSLSGYGKVTGTSIAAGTVLDVKTMKLEITLGL